VAATFGSYMKLHTAVLYVIYRHSIYDFFCYNTSH